MKVLLDTVVLLRAASGSGLSPQARELIAAPETDPLFSAASLLELGFRAKRLKAEPAINLGELRRGLLESGYRELAITPQHAAWEPMLPNIHEDLFDRLLIAQAIVEGVTLLTENPTIMAYPGPIQSAL